MTNKQVIEHLKLLRDRTSNINLFNRIVFDKILQALEKQESMKVLEDETGIFKMGIYFGICPNCNDKVNEVADNNYCGNCGQRLDWSEIK